MRASMKSREKIDVRHKSMEGFSLTIKNG